jgi:DUF2075 family protein
MKDIGSDAEIAAWAAHAGATLHRLELTSQFRCNGSDGYMAYLDQLLGIRQTANTNISELNYDFQICDSPNALYEKVKEKNLVRNRARMVAGYCWPWNSKTDRKANDIVFVEHNFAKQWNLTQDGMLWIISPASVEQIGCIHTCQGLEVDYIGVIIGPDLVVQDGRLVTNPAARAGSDKSVHGWRQLAARDPEGASQLTNRIIRNTYRTLMTRGTKGCFVYAVDPGVREWLRTANNPRVE